MKNYKEVNGYVLIKRNSLLLIVRVLKSLFFIFLSFIIYHIWTKYFLINIDIEGLKYIFFIAIFLFLNYAFINLITSIIAYYNDLIILHEDRIIILQSSLILKDNMEIIYVQKVIKIDWFKTWIIQNILWYWNIIIEQQKNDVRVFHFISKPNIALKKLYEQKNKYINEKESEKWLK